MEKCLQNGGVLVEWKKQMLKIQLLYHAYKELTRNICHTHLLSVWLYHAYKELTP